MSVNENESSNNTKEGPIAYKINFTNNTASVIGLSSQNEKDLFIPRSIIHKSNEYIVTSISRSAFYSCELRSVEIPINSELQIIEESAFMTSKIEKFTIPPLLTVIKISTFTSCHNLRMIGIPNNSELQIIEREAFSYSGIEKFIAPPHLIKICESAFYNCLKLRVIEFPVNSEIKTIEETAFSKTPLESFSIPSSLVDLEDGWSFNTSRLNSISVSPNNPRYKMYDNFIVIGKSNVDSDEYDTICFCCRNVKTVKIPKFIKHIDSCSFNHCEQLRSVEIPFDSQLQTIGFHSFSRSAIEKISFPPHLTKIGQSSFECCEKLRIVDIPQNSELQKIDNCSFNGCPIKSFSFTSQIKGDANYLFDFCTQLQIIEFDEISNVKLYILDSIKRCDPLLMTPAKIKKYFSEKFI